jgi:hypothetical protein
MREKDWLVKVLEEASRRVEAWPDWKKTSDLQQSEQSENNDQKRDEGEKRVAKSGKTHSLEL